MIGRPAPKPTRTVPAVALAVALAFGLSACSGRAAPSSQQPAATVGVAATPGATPGETTVPRPSASARTPAPAELQGRWRTVINDADQPVLTITDFKYTIERLGIGTGSIEVIGDNISFFGSNLCSGRGTYRWSIVEGTLTLDATSPDPCANRADAIRSRPFTRVE